MHGGGPEWLDPPQEVIYKFQKVQKSSLSVNRDEKVCTIFQENGDGREDAEENAEDDANVNAEEADDNNVGAQAQLVEGRNNNNNNNNNNGQRQAVVNNNDEVGNWNPIEWDRAAEELTWERLLGLDGSLIFLEHVFWVVSLNTLFILVFGT